jgi:fibronectin type 3 domain-containing protein
MLRKFKIFWPALGILMLFSTTLKSQQKESLDSPKRVSSESPQIKFFESEWGDQHRYLKWYSTGKYPAKEFYAFRYDLDKPVGVKGIQMAYLKRDTTFYVLQDTARLIQKESEILQYFITPHDTTGKPGESSEIALVAPKGKRWFTKTNADQLVKEKGIKIKWEFGDISLIKFFELYRSTDYYKDYQLLASVSKNDTEFNDTKISPDIVYYYKILAVPVDRNTPVASNIIFAAGFNPNKPLPPFIRQIQAIKDGVVLNIQVSDAEAGGIRIYRDNGLTPELYVISDLIKIPDSMIVVFYDTASGINGRYTYTYSAKTENTSFVESEFSEKAYVRPRLGTPPNAPSEVSLYEEDRIARLFWENMQLKDNTVAGYSIKRKDETAKESHYITIVGEIMPYELNYYNDTTVMAGKTYSYLINSIDVDGNISRSGSVSSIKMQADLPADPFALRGYRSNEGIILEWSKTIYPGIKAVNLYRYERGENPTLIIALPSDSTDFTDANVAAGKIYYYFVTTSNKDGLESKASDEVAVQ